MTGTACIALTGGLGGGKTTFIEELRRDARLGGWLAFAPEAVPVVRQTGISTGEQLFQKAMVYMQMALEDALTRALEQHEGCVIICHRGSLDPLAYWLDRGWSEEEFFGYTGTTRVEHYARYHAVIHLVTAADGATSHYTRWPEADRVETVDEAVRLDRLLQQVWRAHPRYYRVDNEGRDWRAKSEAAREILCRLLEHEQNHGPYRQERRQ